MMGAGLRSAGGRIVMTDMDTIEKSNLNRQFLFRPRDIGRHKSEAAARAMCEMNPDLNVTAYTSAVGEDTEALFSDDEFWPSLDVCSRDTFPPHCFLMALHVACLWRSSAPQAYDGTGRMFHRPLAPWQSSDLGVCPLKPLPRLLRSGAASIGRWLRMRITSPA